MSGQCPPVGAGRPGRRPHTRALARLVGLALGGAALAVVPAAAAGASGSSGAPRSIAAPSSAANSGSTQGVVITAAPSKVGPVLFTSGGLALYAFSADTVGTRTSHALSACKGQCASVWPPLLAPGPDGPFVTGPGVDAHALHTIALANNTYQVTYFGHPLYGFVKDTMPGAIAGEDIGAFNGIWHLLSPRGRLDAGVAVVSLETSSGGLVLESPTAGVPHTLYLLTADGRHRSTCVGPCTSIWPPLLTRGRPVAGPGVMQRGLGVVRRPDGTYQVTYMHAPLYFFSADLSPATPSATGGEYLVDPFAHGVWYDVSPSGLAQAGQVTLQSMTSSLGPILGVTSQLGTFSVYGYSADTPTMSACTGLCAVYWPPVLTSQPPLAGAGVMQSMIGTVQRQHGTFQVTYGGHPLYFFSQDFPGTTKGEGIHLGTGTFDVVSPAGSPVVP